MRSLRKRKTAAGKLNLLIIFWSPTIEHKTRICQRISDLWARETFENYIHLIREITWYHTRTMFFYSAKIEHLQFSFFFLSFIFPCQEDKIESSQKLKWAVRPIKYYYSLVAYAIRKMYVPNIMSGYHIVTYLLY